MKRALRKLLLPAFRRLEAREHRLDYLFLELTQRCQLACLHCGSDCTRNHAQPPLDRDLALGALREIAEHYDPHQITVVLTGGEPLCYPDVFGLGREIHALGFPWGMVSNGWAWTPEAVRAAEAAGMDTFTLSLDGFEADHDWFRGREGSFRRAERALRMLLDRPFWQAMDVVTCVHPRNLPTLDAFRDHLIQAGVPSWRLFTISPLGRAAERPDLRLDADGFQDLMARVARYRTQGGLQVTYSESGYLGRHECVVRDEPCFCRAGIHVAGIMANGDLLACPNIHRGFAQGNLRVDRFVEVWETRYQPFRKRAWMRSGACASCGEWRLCEGNAFHLREPGVEGPHLCHVEAFRL